ncbi:S1C family serine protease [Sphingosinicella terrae]|uniref:S1C family serine protease n=1 Tax=Sphingosinicella terrae TaxID=2172047 RepID=UPI0013B45EDF|nr:serine protease [Sphingosinicella terrae]
MKLRSVLLLLLLGTSSAASAVDWHWLGTWGEGRESFNAYIENESADNDGKTVIWGWVFTHRIAPDADGEVASRAFFAWDCRARRYAVGERTRFDAEAREIGVTDHSADGVQVPQTMSLGQAMLEVVCGETAARESGITDPLAHSLAAFEAGGAHAAAEGSGLSSGTGFFIGAAGHVLTSYHVVEGARRIGCRTVDGQVHDARVVRSSAATDLALLQVDRRPTHYLGFAPAGSAREGDRVFTIGFPAVQMLGSEPRFTDGTISALSVAGENSFLQTSIPIQPGNSGGPVVTESGQVVGIISATAAIEPFYSNTGALPQNVNWAVKAEYAAPLLAPAPPATPRTREQAIALVRSSVCLIVAEQ